MILRSEPALRATRMYHTKKKKNKQFFKVTKQNGIHEEFQGIEYLHIAEAVLRQLPQRIIV